MQSQERGLRNELIIHINVLQLVPKKKHIYRQQKTEILYILKKRREKSPNISKD